MNHSFLPPSGATAWSSCALWPTMNARYPQSDSLESVEGTAAHWVTWEMGAGGLTQVGMVVPNSNGLVITDEMKDGAILWWDEVSARIPAGLTHHIEETIAIPSIHETCFGTPDLWAYDPSKMKLYIFDYKFGFRFVDEFWNKQGLLYLFGILALIEKNCLGDIRNITVTFTIVQPRCYYKGEPVRRHVFTVNEALQFIGGFHRAAAAALSEIPESRTGIYCQDCPGRHACQTLQLAAYSDAEFATDSQPHDISPQAAALELRMLERAVQRLESRVDGLRELTLANLRNGASIPLYHVEPTKPRSQWNQPHEQIIALGEMFNKDLSKPALITPLQAKKLGIDEAVISAYSMTPAGTMKLVQDNPSDIRKVFSNGL